ncbi:MAG TPA: DUF4845 domain-containing protein [Burkholderiales bacterium]|nr:DUF4845 domain-containing protein [Burkholderiales bacterium]
MHKQGMKMRPIQARPLRRQRGVSFMGLIIGAVIVIFLALLGLKVAPAYIEYFSVKKAVTGIASSPDAKGTVGDIRKSFDKRAQIDDITVVSGADLEVSKEGSDVVISFAYPKKVPLFANVSLYFDFAGSSSP